LAHERLLKCALESSLQDFLGDYGELIESFIWELYCNLFRLTFALFFYYSDITAEEAICAAIVLMLAAAMIGNALP
jgi:hypothetical protein